MRRYLFLCMLFPLLTPDLLLAQQRWLMGQVVRIGEHGEDIPEVNITVEIGEQDAVITNSAGRFRVQLRSIFKPGEKVRLAVEKPGWRIRYPLDGEARIPADLDKESVKVELLPVGSKLFWTHDRIENFLTNLAQKSTEQVNPEGRPEPIDFSRHIKDWAVKYGFNAQQAKEEIDKWIRDIEANQKAGTKLGLAEFATFHRF